jgi:hypothetical protein
MGRVVVPAEVLVLFGPFFPQPFGVVAGGTLLAGRRERRHEQQGMKQYLIAYMAGKVTILCRRCRISKGKLPVRCPTYTIFGR